MSRCKKTTIYKKQIWSDGYWESIANADGLLLEHRGINIHNVDQNVGKTPGVSIHLRVKWDKSHAMNT